MPLSFLFTDLILIISILILAFVLSRRLVRKAKKSQAESEKHSLARHTKNPLLSPKEEHWWQATGTFNPAAIADEHGKIHLLYRATGSDGISRFGYSASKDGIEFNDFVPYPVFALDTPRSNVPRKLQRYDFGLYPSGGSWGGAEDPRIVKIDDRLYVTFNAFDGWDFIRIAAVSIKEKDFFEKKWNWSKPLFISPKGEIHKNWVLFPKKINGKFAILHSVSPNVQIDYVDRLEDLTTGRNVIKSRFAQEPRAKGWDTMRRGVGPPPLLTEKGWLVLYHAIDKKDPDRYKLGALLLDLNNPQNVLAKAKNPLLVPDEWYENDWKPGVIYACGAVIKNDTLFVYYGGGDKHVCMASAPLSKIFSQLERV
ncbi:MAG: hypothetical protein V4467_03680 [Patescibacteria group bacterium]